MTTVLVLALLGLVIAALGLWHRWRESARTQFDAAFEKHAQTGLSRAEIDRLCGRFHWWAGRTWLAGRFFAAACAYRGLADEQRRYDAESRKWLTGQDPLEPAHRRRDVSVKDDALLWQRGRELLARTLRWRKRPLALDFERLGVYAPLAGFDWRATTIAENTVIEGQTLRHAVLGDVRHTTFVGCDLTDCRAVGVLHCRGVSFRACRIPDDFWEDVGEYSEDWYDMWLVDGEPPADSVFDEVMSTERPTSTTAQSPRLTHGDLMRQRRALARELRRRRDTDQRCRRTPMAAG